MAKVNTHTQSKSDNFDFPDMVSEWVGYVSSVDKTNLAENIYVQGSQNIYKKLSGTLAVRQGQKRQGIANTDISPCSSEFVWNTSWGKIFTMVVSDGKLWVVLDKIWYALMDTSQTRFVFDSWWDDGIKQTILLFVFGTSDLDAWQGGFAKFVSANTTTGLITDMEIDSAGSGYHVNDVLTITGGGGSSGTATVNTVDASGAIKTLTLLSGGSGYSSTVGASTSGGFGTGATITITVSSGTIVLDRNAAQNGFSSGSVIINGNTYTYTGVSGNDLTGVGSDASAEPVDSIVLSAVIVNADTPASNFNNDFIKVINNQAYVGSYTSNLIYISSDTDYTDYTIPTPRVDGSPELVILDGTGKGIGVRQGNACIGFGANGWAIVSFADVTVGTDLTNVTTVTIKPVALLQAPLAHEFIDAVGDNLIYLSQDQQVREFGDFNSAFVSVFPSLSQEVATELMAEDFTGGCLKCIGEFIYITAPDSGKAYLRQERTRVDANGVVVSEKLWHSPFIWNATRIDQIDGTVVVFSNANPQIYEVWDTGQWFDDSPSDEPLPYSCVLALSYRGEGRRQGLWSFDKNYTEGYIAPGTPLMLQMNYDYQGATTIINVFLDSTTQPAKLFQLPLASLGDNSLGDEPLGNGGILELGEDPNTLPKFKVISSLPITNCFEWQPIFYTNDINAQWEILATATNAGIEEDEQANFLINKKPISMV